MVSASKPIKTTPKEGSAWADADTKAMIYEGLNITQMCTIFQMDSKNLVRKINTGGVKPVGKRGNAEIYALRDVMPYVVKPAFDIDSYIRRMDPRELPKILTKEYWAGQRSRQEYELKEGNLWPTEKVIQEVGELLKLVKMSTLLMLDAVDRQTELSDRQRDIVRTLSRGMLADLTDRIAKAFKPKPPANVKLQEAGIDNDEL